MHHQSHLWCIVQRILANVMWDLRKAIQTCILGDNQAALPGSKQRGTPSTPLNNDVEASYSFYVALPRYCRHLRWLIPIQNLARRNNVPPTPTSAGIAVDLRNNQTSTTLLQVQENRLIYHTPTLSKSHPMLFIMPTIMYFMLLLVQSWTQAVAHWSER